MDNMQEDYLEHWGVKGMRWGFRKKRKESKSSSNESHGLTRSISEDQDRYNKSSRKKYYEMSNKELQDYINRRNLLDQYSKMQKQDALASRSIGKKFADEALKVSKEAAISAGKELLTNAIKTQIKSSVSNAMARSKQK